MEDKRCPFCWDKNLKQINRRGRHYPYNSKRLIECYDCERFYWADSKKEITLLASVCQTKTSQPGKCYPEVKAFHSNSTSPRRKILEFNQLCSTCPQRNFSGAKSL